MNSHSDSSNAGKMGYDPQEEGKTIRTTQGEYSQFINGYKGFRQANGATLKLSHSMTNPYIFCLSTELAVPEDIRGFGKFCYTVDVKKLTHGLRKHFSEKSGFNVNCHGDFVKYGRPVLSEGDSAVIADKVARMPNTGYYHDYHFVKSPIREDGYEFWRECEYRIVVQVTEELLKGDQLVSGEWLEEVFWLGNDHLI